MLAPGSFDRNLNSTGVYGVGTYFAADVRYSLQERYASADADGCQWVLLARVLVGQPCVGREGMKQPSRKGSSADELHDSMVDRLRDPQIFVLSTGSDNHAYPEWLLRFDRRSGRR